MFGNILGHRSGNAFIVRLNNGEQVDATIPRAIARHMFRVLPGDPVTVEPRHGPKPYRIVGFSACDYFKRYWDGNPGGLCADWGGSYYLFEVHPDGYVARQIEQFDNGNLLLYDETHDEDEYGGRSTVPLDYDEYEQYMIDRSEFICSWRPPAAINRNAENATN